MAPAKRLLYSELVAHLNASYSLFNGHSNERECHKSHTMINTI